jgi:hypothetical protein
LVKILQDLFGLVRGFHPALQLFGYWFASISGGSDWGANRDADFPEAWAMRLVFFTVEQAIVMR